MRARSGPCARRGSLAISPRWRCRRSTAILCAVPLALAALFLYPVKSCRGLPLTASEVDRFGLRYDRAFLIVDAESGLFLTQRDEPRLACVVPRLAGDRLELGAAGAGCVDVPLEPGDGARRRVQVWRYQGEAIDQGDAAARFLSELLGRSLRLVRMPADHARRVNPQYAPIEALASFVDGYPFLLLGQGSLDDLGARLAAPLPVERFRSNLLVSGAEPYAEDGWRRIRIGALELLIVKPCDRCSITTVDPELGIRTGDEPLRTLARYRRAGGSVYFAQNAVHVGSGRLEVGMPVEVLERGAGLRFDPPTPPGRAARGRAAAS